VLKNVDAINKVKGSICFMGKAGGESRAINVIASVLLLNGRLIDANNGRRRVLHDHLSGEPTDTASVVEDAGRGGIRLLKDRPYHIGGLLLPSLLVGETVARAHDALTGVSKGAFLEEWMIHRKPLLSPGLRHGNPRYTLVT
jgi:hypothetical protein